MRIWEPHTLRRMCLVLFDARLFLEDREIIIRLEEIYGKQEKG